MQVREIRIVYGKGPTLDGRHCLSPADAAGLVRRFIGAGEPRENFVALLLDSRHRAMALDRVSVGILNSTPVHPREVFRAAIVAGAAAIILAHNHPSGDVVPSGDDLAATRRLIEVGKLVGIEILDSIVVGDVGHYSMRQASAVAF